MTIKDCFGDGLVTGSKILLFGREYSLVEIEHLDGNVYGVTVESGIEGDDTSYVKVSAEHEVLVPATVKVEEKGSSINLTEGEIDDGEQDVNLDDFEVPDELGDPAPKSESKPKSKTASKDKGKSK